MLTYSKFASPAFFLFFFAFTTHGAIAGTVPDSSFESLDELAEAARLYDEDRAAEALLHVERRLALFPDDDEAFRLRVLALAELGASVRAVEAMRERPRLFALHERERLEGDALARRIGWGAVPPERPEQRLDETRGALARLQALQQQAPRQTNWESTRLQVDALSALNQLQRHREVVAGYRALVDEGTEVPAYILPVVGDSLLALRQPGEAASVLREALRHQPGNVGTRVLLAHALMESGRAGEALAELEDAAAGQPAWPRREGARRGYENWDRFQLDTSLALAHSNANDQAAAEQTLEALAGTGPDNAPLQAALAAVQSRRGRPRAALERYEMALTLEPDSRDALAGRVGALTALDRVGEARDALAALQALHPEDVRTPRIADALERHRGPQVTLSAARGRSRPRDAAYSPSPLGSRDGGHSIQVRSPLIHDRWRLGVVSRGEWADFDAGRTRYRGLGAGGWYRHDRLSASLVVLHDRDAAGGDDAYGWMANAGWRIDDAWRVDVTQTLRDPGASLQARRLGITGDRMAVSATWAPDESTRLDLGLERLRYTDGNHRDQASLALRQRVFARPRLLVDALASAAAGRGSRDGSVGYFNPERDASAQLGLVAEHLAWQRYETAFRQTLELAVGPYWQRDGGRHWVPTVGYRHRWSHHGHALEYGVSWSRPVYDGIREQRLMFDVALHWGGAP